MKITNELYETSKGRIINKAASLNKTTGLCFTDLVSVGNESFCMAVNTYKKSKGVPFSAWFNVKLERDLISYARRELTKVKTLDSLFEGHAVEANAITWYTAISKEHKEPLPEHVPAPSVKRQVELKLALEGLSKEARLVVSILLTAPWEIIGLTGADKPKDLKGKVRNFMREKLGMQHKTIWSIRKEIREVLKQF